MYLSTQIMCRKMYLSTQIMCRKMYSNIIFMCRKMLAPLWKDMYYSNLKNGKSVKTENLLL